MKKIPQILLMKWIYSKSNILHSDEQMPTIKTVDETGPPMSRFEINKDDEEKSNIFDKIEPKNTDTDNTQSSERDLNSELVEANQDVSTTNLTSYSGTNDDDQSRSEMPPPSRRNLIEQTWLLALFISVIGLLLLALGLSSYMWYTTSNKEAPPSMPEHQSSNIIDMIPEPAEFVSTQSDLQSMPEYQSQDSTDIFQMVDKAAQLVSIRGQSDLTWLFVGLLWLIPLLQVIILASNFCCCCIHRQNLRGFLVASFACFMIGVIILVTLFFV